MGYTHNWKHETFSSEEWRLIAGYLHELVEKAAKNEIYIQYESDDASPYEVNEEYIRFNGIEEDGHETFILSRRPCDFDFCKTARNPYDQIVGRLLKFCAENVPHFHWSCDDMQGDYKGEKTEWLPPNEDYLTEWE